MEKINKLTDEEYQKFFADGVTDTQNEEKPRGLFYREDVNAQTGKPCYVGIDNLYGHGFAAAFDTASECFRWLLGSDMPKDTGEEHKYPIGPDLPVLIRRDGEIMLVPFKDLRERDITQKGMVHEVVSGNSVIIGKKADKRDATQYSPARLASTSNPFTGCEEYKFGPYMLTPQPDAVTGKVSYWMSKSGCTLAQYCFTACTPGDLMYQLENGLKGYIDLLEAQLCAHQNKKQYAVLFTYDFDSDSEVFLFEHEEAACGFLRLAYEEELRIESEENEWMVNTMHEPDWSYASIGHILEEEKDTDVCEYRVTAVNSAPSHAGVSKQLESAV